ncbi:MAG TPA: hypothetical protein VGH17_09010 [Candidatus Acidoferrales bacterium]|jgi:hypothetical protein
MSSPVQIFKRIDVTAAAALFAFSYGINGFFRYFLFLNQGADRMKVPVGFLLPNFFLCLNVTIVQSSNLLYRVFALSLCTLLGIVTGFVTGLVCVAAYNVFVILKGKLREPNLGAAKVGENTSR